MRPWRQKIFRGQTKIYTPKQDDKRPRLFHIGVLPRGMDQHSTLDALSTHHPIQALSNSLIFNKSGVYNKHKIGILINLVTKARNAKSDHVCNKIEQVTCL